MRPGSRLLLTLTACLLIGIVVPLTSHAQNECGVVDRIDFPVDRMVFELVQDYAVPSPRHQGRYHTGEDYAAARVMSLGTPVRTIAAGRVTFSAPTGWGRDGGVVIIEHAFPDGSLAYSMYGHLQATERYPFPERYTCIPFGAVIGAIGDVRPAPHLHLEIRSAGPDLPGPGYAREVSGDTVFLAPSPFIRNWQAWLDPAHRWHVLLPEADRLISPPVEFSDHSLLFATRDRVRYATSDGRVLWRIVPETPLAALSWWNDQPLLTDQDGGMQLVNLDGTLGERWQTGIPVRAPALRLGDRLLFSTPQDRLVAFAADRRELAWEIDGIPPVTAFQAAGDIVGILSEGDVLSVITGEGQLLSQEVRPTHLAASPQGRLLRWDAEGLLEWDNGWLPATLPDLPHAPESALTANSGSLYQYSGETRLITGFDAAGQMRWQTPLTLTGQPTLTLINNLLLLISDDGFITTLQADTGATCYQMRLYGDGRGTPWHSLGSDGLLRVGLANQIIGLDWTTLVGGCTP